MQKLEKHDAFMLLKSLLQNWSMKDYCLEDEADILDSFLGQIGYPLFLSALEWEGGSNYEQAIKWCGTQAVKQEVSTFLDNCIDPDDFLEGHVKSISGLILELTKQVIQPYVDMEIKRPIVKIIKESKVIETKSFICPVCDNKTSYNNFLKFVSCPRCHTSLEVEDAL